jgi:pSer/pThr/pTyr-binding forkhead associated (FHA) protein
VSVDTPTTGPTTAVVEAAAVLVAPPPLPTAVLAVPRALARNSYDDDAGPHDYTVIKASVSIGRGGVAFPIDVRVTSSTDVSREHARIRHDAEKGRFCLIDLSSLGTTVDGVPVPRGYDEADGTKRENGVEVVLPDRARIGLANMVFLDFRVER